MYEEEINAKVLTPKKQRKGYFYKFNEKAILRTDSKTQMQVLKDAVGNGLYMINEAREYLDKPAVEGGDVPMVNGTFIPLTMVGQQYKKEGGENNAGTTVQSTEPTAGEDGDPKPDGDESSA